MSMYNVVFGRPSDEVWAAVVTILSQGDTANVDRITNLRLRDFWFEKAPDGPPVVAIYTRNGGGNRECWCSPEEQGDCTGCRGDQGTEHSLYIADQDDDFDSTYRTYWFRLPDDLDPELKKVILDRAEEPRDMGARWLEVISNIGKKEG